MMIWREESLLAKVLATNPVLTIPAITELRTVSYSLYKRVWILSLTVFLGGKDHRPQFFLSCLFEVSGPSGKALPKPQRRR